VAYPPAEPTDPDVWRVWSRYWIVQNRGWAMYSEMTDETWTSHDAEWWLWACGQIHAAVERRRAVEAKRKA